MKKMVIGWKTSQDMPQSKFLNSGLFWDSMKHFQSGYVVWCCNGWWLLVLGQYGAVVRFHPIPFVSSFTDLATVTLGCKLCEGNKERYGIRFSHPLVETLQPNPSTCPPYASPPKAKPHSARLPSIRGSVGGRPPPSKHLLRVLISLLSRGLKICCSSLWRSFQFAL